MMTTTQTDFLIALWGADPGPPVLRDPWERPPGLFGQTRAAKAAIRNRPDFGWAVAGRLADSRRTCSLLQRPEYRWIRAAVQLLTGGSKAARRFKDLDVVIMALDLHESDGIRPVLDAVLLTRDATAQTVAEAFRIKPAVVEAYSDLFFDVLGRKDDLSYIRGILGGGKVDLLFSGATMPGDEEILLSAGFEGTIEGVLRVAGLAPDEDISDDDLLKRVRRNGLKAADKWSKSPKALKQSPPAIVSCGFAFASKVEIEQKTETEEDLGEFHTSARAVLDRQYNQVQARIEGQRLNPPP